MLIQRPKTLPLIQCQLLEESYSGKTDSQAEDETYSTKKQQNVKDPSQTLD